MMAAHPLPARIRQIETRRCNNPPNCFRDQGTARPPLCQNKLPGLERALGTVPSLFSTVGPQHCHQHGRDRGSDPRGSPIPGSEQDLGA